MGRLQRVITMLFCVSVFGAVVCQDCLTPEREIGSCIPVDECKHVRDFLITMRGRMSNSVLTRLNAYNCGFQFNTVKVCCPSRPITLGYSSTTPATRLSSGKKINMLPEECGYFEAPSKIFNGEDAALNEFPWMALISYTTDKGPKFECGGSVLNDRYILTAAHCLTNIKNPLLGVRVGEHNIRTKIDCDEQISGRNKCMPPVQDLAIEEALVHPDYNSTDISNDIGLLRVSKIDLNVVNVQPVCLPTGTARSAKFNHGVVTGWGATELGTGSLILQKVELPIVSLENCQKVYNIYPNLKITDKQLCAGGKAQKDSCLGDSGGPLQAPAYLNNEMRYVQHGIVSFGHKICGLVGFPGVYTKVSNYMDWILNSMKP